MTRTRPMRFMLLLLLPFFYWPAFAQTTADPTPKMSVMGDSVTCPKGRDGEIPVCGDKISAASLLNLQAYASCLVVHHGTEAGLAVRAYATRRDRDPLRALVADDHWCAVNGGARASAILLASALVEHLPGWRGRLREGFTKVDQPVDMIRCVIATSPRLALAVLRSAPMSDDELDAVHMLVPHLPACLPTGVQLETNRAALRAMLALALLDPDAPDSAGRDLATGLATPLLASPEPLHIVMPRIAMTPLAKVGAMRDRSANATVPTWTLMPDNGLHHGGYGHPDLPQQLLPEDELAASFALPDKDSGNPAGPVQSSLPNRTAPPQPQDP